MCLFIYIFLLTPSMRAYRMPSLCLYEMRFLVYFLKVIHIHVNIYIYHEHTYKHTHTCESFSDVYIILHTYVVIRSYLYRCIRMLI